MKKLWILAIAAIAFTGCNSDDGPTAVSGEVTGTYHLTAATSSEAHDGNGDGNATTNLITEAGCFDQSTLVLAANGSASNTLFIPFGEACGDFTATGNYTQSGNTVAVTVSFEGETETFNYTASGNTLTVLVPDFYEIEVTVGSETFYESIDATLVYTRQ